VAYLNEYPSVIQGDFDPAFLSLPDEILVTVMRDHQKYFAVEKKNGELAPHFLAVINVAKDSKGIIRAGTNASFARASPMRNFSGRRIRNVGSPTTCRSSNASPTNRGSGAIATRSNASAPIARWFTEQWFNLGMLHAHVAEADRAAELAKCDLATEMVREFTELQGIVGGLYARAQGESDEIADAVYDHYRPVGLEDPIPRQSDRLRRPRLRTNSIPSLGVLPWEWCPPARAIHTHCGAPLWESSRSFWRRSCPSRSPWPSAPPQRRF